MGRTRWAVLVLCVAGALLAGACSSGSSDTVATDGPEVVRYSFEGSPSRADEQATVDVLNRRFDGGAVGARAVLVDGGVVVRATTGTPPSTDQIEALARPGALQFRPVLEVWPPEAAATTSTTAAVDPTDPGAEVLWPELDANGEVMALYRMGPTLVDGSAVESASAGRSLQGQWEVRPVLRVGAAGIVAFNAAAALCSLPSASCPTGELAVALDGRVLTAPTVQTAEFERDQITVSGSYTEDEATAIAVLLGSGSLPAPLRVAGR